MWRTSVVVLLSLTLLATGAPDPKQLVGVAPIQAARVPLKAKQEDSLVAIAPLNLAKHVQLEEKADDQVYGIAPLSKAQLDQLKEQREQVVGVAPIPQAKLVELKEQREQVIGVAPIKHVEESTFSRAIRALRNPETMQKVFRAIGLGSRLDDKKQIVEVDTDGAYATLFYGTSPKSVGIKSRLTLDNAVSYVYGKACQNDGVCRKTKPATIYDENQGTDTKTAFSYTVPGVGVTLTGTIYSASVARKSDESGFPATFGVVTGTNSVYDNLDDGVVGLGFSNPGNDNLKNLFTAGPNPFITIYRGADNKGKLAIGNNSWTNCPETQSPFYDTIQNDQKIQQWWFKLDNMTMGADTQGSGLRVGFDLSSDVLVLPKGFADKVGSITDKDGNVSDLKSLNPIVITIGKETYQLDPADFTQQDSSTKKYKVLVAATPSGTAPDVKLGGPFLRKFCVVLNGQDLTKPKIGFTYKTSSAQGLRLSLMGLLLIPLVQMLRF